MQALLKVASDKREEMRWERELEWRQKQRNSRSGSTCVLNQQQQNNRQLQQSNKQLGPSSRGPSTLYERRPSNNECAREKDKRNAGKY